MNCLKLLSRITLTFVTLAFTISSCKKEEPQPNDTSNETTDETTSNSNSIKLANNSIIMDGRLFRSYNASEREYFDDYNSEINFYNDSTSATSDNMYKMRFQLQNSSPTTGEYNLSEYSIYLNTSAGKNNIAINLEPRSGNTFYHSSTKYPEKVNITNLGDSILVEFNNIYLKKSGYSSTIKVSGKVKIATKPIKPIYVGNATVGINSFTKIKSTFSSYFNEYTYLFEPSNLYGYESFEIISKEELKSDKTYTIVEGSASNSDEIQLKYKNNLFVNHASLDNSNTFNVTKNTDGSISFSFNNVTFSYYDLNSNTSGTKVISGNGKFQVTLP